MNRGEVWLYESPHAKARPVCILTRQGAIAPLDKILVAPATSTIRDIVTEVRLGVEDGVRHECVLTLDNVFPVEKAFLTRRIATLREPKLSEVCAALRAATRC